MGGVYARHPRGVNRQAEIAQGAAQGDPVIGQSEGGTKQRAPSAAGDKGPEQRVGLRFALPLGLKSEMGQADVGL